MHGLLQSMGRYYSASTVYHYMSQNGLKASISSVFMGLRQVKICYMQVKYHVFAVKLGIRLEF